MYQYTTKLKKVGEILRDKRKEKGLDFSQISEIIKVRVEYLKALENANFSIFASEVQIKGFLKKYVKFLGIEEEKALAMYRREREGLKDDKVIKTVESAKGSTGFVLTPGKLVAAIVIGTILAVLIYIGSQLNEVIKAPTLSVSVPVDVTAGNEGNFTTDAEEIIIGGDIEAGAILTINGTKVTTNNLQKYQIVDIKLKDGENKFVLVAESQFGRKSEITLNIVRQSSGEEVTMEFSITATTRNQISVTADNASIFNGILNKDESLDFTATSIATISSSKIDQFEIKINGEAQSTALESSITWEIINGEITKR